MPAEENAGIFSYNQKEGKGGTFAENRVKYTVVCKDFRNNHGISDIGIERWTPV